MMHIIMLVDRLPLITREKLNHRMGTLFYEKVVLSKQMFYENLGRVLPDPSETSEETELLWRSKFLRKGFYENVLIKQHMILSRRPEQLPRATTLPWNGTGLSP